MDSLIVVNVALTIAIIKTDKRPDSKRNMRCS